MPCEQTPSESPIPQIISTTTVVPATKSTLPDLKLSTSDLPMLSCHYIQKGNLFHLPHLPTTSHLLPLLRRSLSAALSLFPPLAGRLTTTTDNHIFITSNDAGAIFTHAISPHLTVADILSPIHVPDFVKTFFSFDGLVSYAGHDHPILGVQVTQIQDGVFIGFSVNHSVVDGTSLWNFINSFAQITREMGFKGIESMDFKGMELGFKGMELDLDLVKKVKNPPCFERESVMISPAVLKVPAGGPKVTFDEHAPLTERIFSFSKESISRLKEMTNSKKRFNCFENGGINAVEVMGKQSNDTVKLSDETVTALIGNWLRNAVVSNVSNFSKTTPAPEISSFQSLCALLWRAVTRARKFPDSKTTTFRMAVNCRHRLEPELKPYYFGNAIQSIPTYATAGDVLSHDLRWCAEQLNKNVLSHDNKMVRRFVYNWEQDPRCFPLGNFDGAMLTMGSSPRFPMFDNDFGWGKPVVVRSGRANKFDGKISAFPGREGGGSVDLEVVLSPETMTELESDEEFMRFVSGKCC